MNESLQSSENYLYDRVVNRISRLIDQGTLRAGDRIPSIRKLSSKDGVSVSTVLQAYLVLESKGLIEAKPQSGFYVRLRRDLPAEPKPSNPSAAVTRVGVNELVLQVVHAASNPEMMNLGAGIPGLELLPIKRLNRILGMLARRCDAAGINYDFPPGFESLRRQIAKRSLEWGCSLTADDIVTTNGAMEALNLSIRAVAKPGNIIAIESPTFYGTLQVIESLGMKAVEIPMHPRDGIILDALESAIKKYRIKACVVSANFSNPLGSCMPDKNKEALVKLLSHREIPLIEDDIYGDLHFGPIRPKTAKAYDRSGLVLLCSSFSKTIAPGYRVGWTAPGRFKAAVESLKFMTSMATATLPQMAIAEFLESGGYDRHLRKMKRAFTDQMQLVTAGISQYFPKGTKVARPRGGFLLWVELPQGVDSLKLHGMALREKISITPGPLFSAKQRYKNFIRLNCGQVMSDRIEQSLSTLGRLTAKLIRSDS
jgi:DNA-binding transcriptional MocR family regulator